MSKPINNIKSKNINCTGCGACVDSCPVKAITLISDKEGFKVPHIDAEKCINCSKCINTCPDCSISDKHNFSKECYAVVLKNDEIKSKSSSGGVFPAIAKKFINNGGYVCAAIYNKNFEVEHIISNQLEDIPKMQGSKYVQSNLKDSYSQIEILLKDNKKVLFVGTPCQVAGLKKLLKTKNIQEENLYTCDLICYGVPSPKVLKKYLQEIFSEEKILNINMREKSNGESCFKVITDKNTYCYPHTDNSINNLYIKLFFNNLCLRKSCENCRYTNLNRVGDITLGDFWGIEKFNKKMDSKSGISCILPNNKKGKKLLFSLKKEFKTFKKISIKYPLKGQPRLNFPTQVNKFKRKDFFDNLDNMTLVENYQRVLKNKSDFKIINYWFAVNYGAALTCYALKRFIEKQGYSVKTINYVEDKIAKQRHYETSKAKIFAEKYLNLTNKCNNYEELKELNNNTEYFVVGSDQVWKYERYSDHGGNIYQLNFVNDNKRKFAYSASFGSETFDAPENEKDIFKYLINRFDAISVREKSGLDILSKEFDIDNATRILDPVFTLDSEDLALLTKDIKPAKEKYVASFKYMRKSNPDWCDLFEKSIAEKLNMPLNKLIYDYECDIERFVAYIRDCEFLITDSFHAACFAILFKKPFVILGLADGVIERMHSLVETFNIDSNIIVTKEQMSEINAIEKALELFKVSIDYQQIQKIIKSEKKVAEMWLINSINSSQKILNKQDSFVMKLLNENAILQDKVKEYNFNLNIIKKAPETIIALVVYKILENIFRNNKRFAERRKFHSSNFRILKKIFLKY